MQEAEIGRIMVPGQHRGQKISQDHFSLKKSWVWWHVPVIPTALRSVK
jgi:hypothetical protein